MRELAFAKRRERLAQEQFAKEREEEVRRGIREELLKRRELETAKEKSRRKARLAAEAVRVERLKEKRSKAEERARQAAIQRYEADAALQRAEAERQQLIAAHIATQESMLKQKKETSERDIDAREALVKSEAAALRQQLLSQAEKRINSLEERSLRRDQLRSARWEEEKKEMRLRREATERARAETAKRHAEEAARRHAARQEMVAEKRKATERHFQEVRAAHAMAREAAQEEAARREAARELKLSAKLREVEARAEASLRAAEQQRISLPSNAQSDSGPAGRDQSSPGQLTMADMDLLEAVQYEEGNPDPLAAFDVVEVSENVTGGLNLDLLSDFDIIEAGASAPLLSSFDIVEPSLLSSFASMDLVEAAETPTGNDDFCNFDVVERVPKRMKDGSQVEQPNGISPRRTTLLMIGRSLILLRRADEWDIL